MERPVARILTDLYGLAEDPAAGSGARWKLAEPGRQLDANLVHLPAGRRIEQHVEPELDVVLVVVAGDGTFGTADGPQQVAAGNLVWLPHGSARDLTAGADGLSYLTVHRRRPGLQIKTARPRREASHEGGEARR
ncbi:MAG TPA: hypothetical protein VGL05_30040 [Kribbella sp.]